MGLKILRPPKINTDPKSGFWKQIGMIVLGSTISLALTIAATKLVELRQRDRDRQLTAMTVMSGIYLYAYTTDSFCSLLGRGDTVAQWLLSRPVEELEQLPEEELQALVDDAVQLYSLTYDNSTYEIFSSGIETWKNMRSYRFITNVGMCYSLMSSTTERWNRWGDEIDKLKLQIRNNPDEYPGANHPSKCLRNAEFRSMMEAVHSHRDWLHYRSQSLKYYNLVNMALMGVSEEELVEFLEKSLEPVDVGMDQPGMDYETPAPNPDSLTSMEPLNARLDSLLQHKQQHIL